MGTSCSTTGHNILTICMCMHVHVCAGYKEAQASTHADVRMCVGKNMCADTHYQFM